MIFSNQKVLVIALKSCHLKELMRTGRNEHLDYLDSFYRTNLSPEFLAKMETAREESRQLNREGISVSLSEAYLISELVRQSQSAAFMELGSLTGYSALFLLRGLKENGTLYCFEKDDHCALFLKNLFADTGSVPELKGKKVVVVHGDARQKLDSWEVPSGLGGVFIDANKAAYVDYLNWIESRLSGSYLVIADNVFLSGSVWGAKETSFSAKQIQVMNEFNMRLMNNPVNNLKYSSFFIGTSEGLLVAKRQA